MKKYFYTDGTTNFGPFTLEELKQENIRRDTQVWCQGMKEWARAESLPELEELFELVPPRFHPEPPPAPRPVASVHRQQPPKSWLTESILVTLFCCWPLGIPGIVNASRVESRFYAGDVEGAEQASDKARRWVMISFWVGIGLVALVVLIYLILILVGVAVSDSYNV